MDQIKNMLTIRHFIGAYGSLQIMLSFLAALGVSAIYSLHSHFCHQMDERSFHLGHAKFSLCARCMGVYVGLAVAAFIQSKLSPLLKRNLFLAMTLSFTVFALEKFYLEPSHIEAGNVLRFFVGIGLGYCLAIVVFFLWDPKEANPFNLTAGKAKN